VNVTLCSAFRNSAGYIARYFEQVTALQESIESRGDCLYLVLAEGDSTDDTPERLDGVLSELGVEATLLGVTHGGKDYGSVVNAERFANLAKVWNAIWQRIPEDADAVIFVESDLIWATSTMLALLDDLEHVPCVAPMVMMKNGWFWDTWGFVRNGHNFRNQPPFHAEMTAQSLWFELDSAGSCLVMRGDVARRVHWPAADVVKGVCKQIIDGGDSVWLNTRQKVMHP